MMNRTLSILGFAGSLRKQSYNKSILRAARTLALADMTIDIFDLEGIPLFNQDFENSPLPIVMEFKARIKASDALLIATPEYNFSIPGVLKNAIDWASRPYTDNSFKGKPVAIMGASGNMIGTARAQYHLRQCFVWLDMHPLNRPEVMVPLVKEKIDADGNLTDEFTKQKIRELLIALGDWTRRLNK